MARPRRVHVPGAFFHVTQRGNDRRPIFLDDQDRLRYLGIVAEAVGAGSERLHAYCLLSNHVHLLLQSVDRPLSELMQRVGTRHARTFNDRWARSGHLFQGRFHASYIASDPHLLLVVRYIHLNPCRAGLVHDPSAHRWSSHRAYLGDAAPSWLCTRHVLGLLQEDRTAVRASYEAFMSEGLDEEMPLFENANQAGRTVHRAERASSAGLPLERILHEVARHSGCSVEEICGRGRGRRATAARFAVVHLGRHLARIGLTDLARVLRRNPSTLCNGVARQVDRSTEDWRTLIEGAKLSLTSEKEKGKPDPLFTS